MDIERSACDALMVIDGPHRIRKTVDGPGVLARIRRTRTVESGDAVLQ